MGVLRPASSAQGLSILCRKMSLAWQKHLVHVPGVLPEEVPTTEKVKGLRRGHGLLKKMSLASMKPWISGLTFSCLDCSNEVRERPPNGWRELSSQDGSAERWFPRRPRCSKIYCLAPLALCHHTFLLLSRSVFGAVPNPAFLSLSLLCRSRENNGENNTLLRKKGAVNLGVTVSIRVVTKVGFYSDSPGIVGLYPSPPGHQGYERPKPAKTPLIFRLSNQLDEWRPIIISIFSGVAEEQTQPAGCCCPSAGAGACSGGLDNSPGG